MAEVLIVDDEPAICDLLRDGLTNENHQCTIVLTGKAAITLLTTHDFGVVLLDIGLPDMSGMEVLRQIQTNCGIVTIVITGVNDIDIAVEAIKLGASDYIVKPFNLDKVNARVCAALEMRQHLLTQEDYSASSKGGKANGPGREALSEMEAIAFGVESKYDLLTNHQNTVAKITIDIARQLEIPEPKIQRWAARQAKLNSGKNRVIESLLDRLIQNPLAQLVMGMTELHYCEKKPHVTDN